jgi:hypothetical protein
MSRDGGPNGYGMFDDEEGGCVRAVFCLSACGVGRTA